VIINTTTIGSEDSKRFAKEVSNHGGFYIECPVLGSTPQAQSGNLQLLLTCPKEWIETHKEMFEALGKIRYIGDQYGKSSVFKLAFNQMIITQMASFGYAVSLSKAHDLPLDLFSEIVRGSAIHSKYFDLKIDKMATRNYGDATFSVANIKKDASLAAEELEHVNIDASAMQAMCKQFDEAIKLGFGEVDAAGIIEGIMPRKDK